MPDPTELVPDYETDPGAVGTNRTATSPDDGKSWDEVLAEPLP